MQHLAICYVMSRIRFTELKRFLHFVNKLDYDSEDKLFKIRLTADAARQECNVIKSVPLQKVDEQIISFKIKSINIK